MSGHSKWSTIKHKKAAKDEEKGKLFSKLSRSITLAVVEGGGLGDPEKNVRLRLAIAQARAASMPKDNITRAIEKGSGAGGEKLVEVLYEAFGPAGTQYIIQAATDNPNRTLPEVRSALEKNGGKLGIKGSVAYLFRMCGMIRFDPAKDKEDEILIFADAIAAFDIETDPESTTVYFPFENLGKVKDCIGTFSNQSPEVDYKPLSAVILEDKADAHKVLKLIEALEELDDVHKVYGNFEIPQNVT